MYEIFEQLLQNYGVTPYKVSKETGVSQSTLSDWKLGKITPKTSTLQKLAEYFGVTLDFLLSGRGEHKEDPDASFISNDDDIKKHIDKIMESLEGQDKIVYGGKEVKLSEQNKRMLRYAMEIAYEAAKNNK